MEDPIYNSLASTAKEVRGYVERQCTLPEPSAGFFRYTESATIPVPDRNCLLLPWPEDGQLKYPQTLSCFGFMLGIDSSYERALQTQWIESCQINLQKDLFQIDRQTFVFRPIEVLGIALGIASVSSIDGETREAFVRVVTDCLKKANTDSWSMLLYWFSLRVVGSRTIPMPRLKDGDGTVEIASLLKWLSFQPAVKDELLVSPILDWEEMILRCAAHGNYSLDDPTKAIIFLQSLHRSIERRIQSRLDESRVVPSTHRDACQLVIQLCRNFHLFARQLQKRRKDVSGSTPKERLPRPTIKMEDEYDVQDALHAILLLHFEDVRAEPWTPEYAANQNRIDFVLPDFEIAIEVKHTRDRLTQRDVTDQLIIDERYYQNHANCKHLICFVYDPNLMLKNPLALEKDLRKVDGDFQVTVVVCPQGK